MTRFLDSSVIVPVFVASHPHHTASIRLYNSCSVNHDCCAAHSPVETFAALTRLPFVNRATPSQARACIENIVTRLRPISLEGPEYVATVQEAEEFNITGGTIYDSLIAACALKGGADEIFTWNMRHFQLLGPEVVKRLKTPD